MQNWCWRMCIWWLVPRVQRRDRPIDHSHVPNLGECMHVCMSRIVPYHFTLVSRLTWDRGNLCLMPHSFAGIFLCLSVTVFQHFQFMTSPLCTETWWPIHDSGHSSFLLSFPLRPPLDYLVCHIALSCICAWNVDTGLHWDVSVALRPATMKARAVCTRTPAQFICRSEKGITFNSGGDAAGH